MRMAWREIAAWTRSRKLLTSLAIALTLCIGMLIGTVISGRVSATHSFFAVGATPLAEPDATRQAFRDFDTPSGGAPDCNWRALRAAPFTMLYLFSSGSFSAMDTNLLG